MRWLIGTCLIGLFACSPAFAVGGGTERQDTVDPTFWNTGNTWRITATPVSSTLVLLSSAPERATVYGASFAVLPPNLAANQLGISLWRERYIVNLCTTAALAIYPAPNTGFNTFMASMSVIISSAGAGNSWVSLNNTLKVYHQDEIWGVWDNGAGGGSAAACGGAVVVEEYTTGSIPKRR